MLRGNVFCNAQTGNVVLLGLAIGTGKISQAIYYLSPISAYLAGAFISEIFPNPVKHNLMIRWDMITKRSAYHCTYKETQQHKKVFF